MCMYIYIYIYTCVSLWLHGRVRFRAETRHELSTRFSPECGGGVSIGIVAGSMLRVLTLKDGRGMPVS